MKTSFTKTPFTMYQGKTDTIPITNELNKSPGTP
jgi:hypothetical protein